MNYSEQPERQNRVLAVWIWVTMIGGILLFACSMYLPDYPALLQLIGVGLMVAAILLVGHYQTRYTYRIEPDARGGEGRDFVVIQHKGRRETVVCRLGVEDVREIEHQTPENRDALKKKYADQKDVVHAYCIDLLPADSHYLRFDDGGDRVVIRLQASRELIAIFEAALPRT